MNANCFSGDELSFLQFLLSVGTGTVFFFFSSYRLFLPPVFCFTSTGIVWTLHYLDQSQCWIMRGLQCSLLSQNSSVLLFWLAVNIKFMTFLYHI